jgi:hypothetical protein
MMKDRNPVEQKRTNRREGDIVIVLWSIKVRLEDLEKEVAAFIDELDGNEQEEKNVPEME